jgi:hypothetical protein
MEKERRCIPKMPRADGNGAVAARHGLEIAIIRLLQSCHETKRGASRVSVRRRIIGRGRRAHLVAASIALLPALAGCSSSSSSIDYAADAYPSQSLVEILKGSTESPPPAQTATPPPPQSSPVAAANEPRAAAAAAPATAVAPAPAPVAAAAPAPSAPGDSDPVAAAYPSVSLIDLLAGSTKPAH